MPTTKEKWAKQAVLKVDDGLGGALLGVGCISGKGGEKMVVCLTEGELECIIDRTVKDSKEYIEYH